MALQLDHLALDPLPSPQVHGKPLALAIASIDEDPDQPRQEFDDQALAELAQTIAARGVRQPVSVRPHPQQPGRWMLNFGARRLRASKLAGRVDIPAFVDATADSYDQVIENEHRAALKPLELALFVQRRLAKGETQAEIARGLGKSPGYLTFVGALIDAPDWLLDLYRSGRCRGLTELYELRRLHQADPASLMRWLAAQAHVGRAEVQAYKLRAQVACEPPKASRSNREAVGNPPSPARIEAPATAMVQVPAPTPARPHGLSAYAADSRARSPGEIRLWARLGRDVVVIDLSAMPEVAEQVFVRSVGPGADGRRTAVEAQRLVLLRVARDPG